MMRWDSMSLPLSASSIRTPKMAPVEPVMPMMRRRIQVLRRGRHQCARKPFGCKYEPPRALSPRPPAGSILEQVAKLLPRDAALLRRRHVHAREFVAPVPRPACVDDRAAVGIVAQRLALRLDPRIERRRPGVADDVDRGGGVGARQQGPACP